MSVLDWLFRKLDKINGWFLLIGFVSLIGMVVVDFVNIVSLQLGYGMVIPSGKELIEELMVVTVYCGVAFVLLRQEDIKTEVLTRHFRPRLRTGALFFRHLVAVFISGLLLWRSIALLKDTWVIWSVKMGLLDIPLFPSRLLMTLAFILLFTSALLVLIRSALSKGSEVVPPSLDQSSPWEQTEEHE